ncbi:alkene reductase [Rhodococcoides kyotonense]|uniref:N-ethylmaleimide reductase n=1 Tax=Rhodococcoides kyotonense TaxID=398843 RepID=A0A239MCT0_9NOCA|nr:alkene reductase [Rhodococcus kyotonensis]SNT39788.1 N-ethylmaleimide reductase [Rhodococcus kyotonensis]
MTTPDSPRLFEPLRLGSIELPNRIVMSPMGRGRATRDGTAEPIVAEYYGQRASAALIIAEATHPSIAAVSHPHSVRLHSAEHAAAWTAVTNSVHERGGRIFLQIMHAGRMTHSTLHGSHPLAPSAVKPAGHARTFFGPREYEVPRPMTRSDIGSTIDDFVRCARTAVDAGFDGVELHAANGYLLHQFLGDVTNTRSDRYGGSASHRSRFVLETTAAVAEAIGGDRVGVRLSPGFPLNDMHENEPVEVYTHLVQGLTDVGVAYLHFVAGSDPDTAKLLRRGWPGLAIMNAGTGGSDVDATLKRTDTVLNDGFDLVSFGRHFIANPDLPERLSRRTPLSVPDPTTFYEGGRRGYIDYPIAASSSTV